MENLKYFWQMGDIIDNIVEDFNINDWDCDFRMRVQERFDNNGLFSFREVRFMDDDGVKFSNSSFKDFNRCFFVYNGYTYTANYTHNVTRVNHKTGKAILINFETFYKNFIKFIKEINDQYFHFELRYKDVKRPNVETILN